MAHRDTVQSPKSDDGARLSRRRFLQGGLATAAAASALALPAGGEAAPAAATVQPEPHGAGQAGTRQRPQHPDHHVRPDALPAVL